MTTEQHHYEVIVLVEDGEPIDIYVNDEHSATWHEGTVWDSTLEIWRGYDDDGYSESVADDALNRLLKGAEDLCRTINDK
jgi:hypothetical protein